MSERFLVTGAMGCIGAWTVKQLVESSVPVWTYDLPGSGHRLRLILDDDALGRVTTIAGDITDFAHFEQVVVENGITHIVHLAALQVPFVRANPVLGAQVNVVGSTIVLETVKRHADQIQGLVYASSTGVYGPASHYPPGPLAHDAPLEPPTLYGVTKQANEGMARIYWQEYGLRSVGLRPYIIYGAGSGHEFHADEGNAGRGGGSRVSHQLRRHSRLSSRTGRGWRLYPRRACPGEWRARLQSGRHDRLYGRNCGGD